MPPKPGNAFAQQRGMEQQTSQSSLQHSREFSQDTTSSTGTVIALTRNNPDEAFSTGAATSAPTQDLPDMPDTPNTTMAMFIEETAPEERQDNSEEYSTPLSRKKARKQKKKEETKRSASDVEHSLPSRSSATPARVVPEKQSGLDFIRSTFSKGKRVFSRTTSTSSSRPGNAFAPSAQLDTPTSVSNLQNTDPAVIYATARTLPQSNTPAASVSSAGRQRPTLPNIHVPVTAGQDSHFAGSHIPRTTLQESATRDVEVPTNTSDPSGSLIYHAPTTTSHHSEYHLTPAPRVTSQQLRFSDVDARALTAQPAASSSMSASTATFQPSAHSDFYVPTSTSQPPAASNVGVSSTTSQRSVHSGARIPAASMQQYGFPSVRVAPNRTPAFVPDNSANTTQPYIPQSMRIPQSSSIPDRHRLSTAYNHRLPNLPPFRAHAGMMPYSSLVPRRHHHDRQGHISTATQHTYGTTPSQYASVNPNEAIILSETSITPTRQGTYAVAGNAELVSRPSMASMTGIVNEVSPTIPRPSSRPMISDPAYITTAHGEIPATSLYNHNASEDTRSEGQKSEVEEAAEVTDDENDVQNLLRRSRLRRAFSSSNLDAAAPAFVSRSESAASSAGSPAPAMLQDTPPVLAAPPTSPRRAAVDNNSITTYGGPAPTPPHPSYQACSSAASQIASSFAVLHHRLENDNRVLREHISTTMVAVQDRLEERVAELEREVAALRQQVAAGVERGGREREEEVLWRRPGVERVGEIGGRWYGEVAREE